MHLVNKTLTVKTTLKQDKQTPNKEKPKETKFKLKHRE